MRSRMTLPRGRTHTRRIASRHSTFLRHGPSSPSIPLQHQRVLHSRKRRRNERRVVATPKKGGDSNNNNKDGYDKEYFKNQKCFSCQKKGHPASNCPNKDDDNSSSIYSKSSKSSSNKMTLEKQFKSIKKSFAQLQSTLEENDSDILDEED